MLKLCGFHISNYFNKARIAMLEKGLPFELDPTCRPSQEDAFLARSPLGKVPFIEVDGAQISESQVICEYLEDAYPQKPLLPRDPLERARVRELITILELHMELVARRLYPQVFFGRPPMSDDARRAVEKDLAKGVRAFRMRAKFDPYVAGAQLTLADCAAFVHLPLVSLATKAAFGQDMLESMPQIKAYLKMVGERPAFRTVNEDRKAAQAAMQKK
ncbi:MAG TPA: glutathione S-transferase family protein [Burkholderiales bacterium]|nr:glutathione S-transferase family protein [Burkholderiales bacterium]